MEPYADTRSPCTTSCLGLVCVLTSPHRVTWCLQGLVCLDSFIMQNLSCVYISLGEHPFTPQKLPAELASISLPVCSAKPRLLQMPQPGFAGPANIP